MRIGIVYGANKEHAAGIGEALRRHLNLEPEAVRDVSTVSAHDLEHYDIVIAGMAVHVKREIEEELYKSGCELVNEDPGLGS